MSADGDVVPVGYAQLLEQLKARVRTTQLRAARAANSEVLALYWSVGRDILDRQDRLGWGAGVVDRLAGDLRAAFPDQRGWSASNLLYMRGSRPRGLTWRFPHRLWGHSRGGMSERCWTGWTPGGSGTGTPPGPPGRAGPGRCWSPRSAAGCGRVGAAPSNFAEQLPAADSDLAQQLVRDPYVFDHLSLTGAVAERDLEQALMDRLQATLVEFGHGMAFVGRQVRFDLDGDEQVVDLLLFHVEQLRYIVVELKVHKLTGGDVGQLGTYVAMVDDRLRRPGLHAPTLRLLLVAGRSEHLVRYALTASSAPVAVADWSALPDDARALLPPADRIAAALDTSTLPAAAGAATEERTR